jgi:RNA polymerase sigma factor for flagellar operon FliA
VRPLTDRERELAASHARLVEQLVNVMFRTRPETLAYGRDDARSDAALALARAAQDWRDDGGASFRTFAARRITGAILDGLRRTDVVSRTEREALNRGDHELPSGRPITVPSFVSFDGPGGDELLACDTVVDAIAGKELALGLRELVRTLPQREAHIVSRVYFEDATRREVARELGLDPSRVSQLLSGAYQRLQGRAGALTEAA